MQAIFALVRSYKGRDDESKRSFSQPFENIHAHLHASAGSRLEQLKGWGESISSQKNNAHISGTNAGGVTHASASAEVKTKEEKMIKLFAEIEKKYEKDLKEAEKKISRTNGVVSDEDIKNAIEFVLVKAYSDDEIVTKVKTIEGTSSQDIVAKHMESYCHRNRGAIQEVVAARGTDAVPTHKPVAPKSAAEKFFEQIDSGNFEGLFSNINGWRKLHKVPRYMMISLMA